MAALEQSRHDIFPKIRAVGVAMAEYQSRLGGRGGVVEVIVVRIFTGRRKVFLDEGIHGWPL
jgi:hypothetical protein